MTAGGAAAWNRWAGDPRFGPPALGTLGEAIIKSSPDDSGLFMMPRPEDRGPCKGPTAPGSFHFVHVKTQGALGWPVPSYDQNHNPRPLFVGNCYYTMTNYDSTGCLELNFTFDGVGDNHWLAVNNHDKTRVLTQPARERLGLLGEMARQRLSVLAPRAGERASVAWVEKRRLSRPRR